MKDAKIDHRTACLHAVCDPDQSRNPVAWFDLEAEGFTRELLAEASADSGWQGPAPYFENAPSRDSAIWKLMEEQRSAAAE